MALPSDSAALLSEAISKVYGVKSCVSTALHLCPDVPDLGPAAADSTLECLERAQQQLLQLQQLAPQLQQIAASAQQQQQQQPQQQSAAATQPTQQQSAAPPPDSWTSQAQQQAATAAAVLQDKVQAAVCLGGGAGPALLQPPRQQQRPYYDYVPMLQLLQYTASVVPHIQLHLFRSSSNQLHCSIPWLHRSSSLEQQLAKYSQWIDEVRVVCPGVFVASVALAAPGSLDPVRVCVDSEDKTSSVDAWSSSKHQVFKRISNLAVRALLHFQKVQQAHTMLDSQGLAAAAAVDPAAAATSSSSSVPSAGVALTCLLLWLSCFDDLFSRPCDVSGKLIAWEPATAIPLPPVLRPYWLSLERLTEAARDRSKRKAYHIQHTPWLPVEQQAAAATAAQQQQQQRTHMQLPAQQQQEQQQQQQTNMQLPAQQQQQPQQPTHLGAGSEVLSGQVAASVTDEQLMQHLQSVLAQ